MKEFALLYAFPELAITGELPLMIRIISLVYLAIKSFGVSSTAEVHLITTRIVPIIGEMHCDKSCQA